MMGQLTLLRLSSPMGQVRPVFHSQKFHYRLNDLISGTDSILHGSFIN